MPRRYLFGPVTPTFAEQNLYQARQSGECLAFGYEGPDLVIDSEESWESIQGRLPAGWQPDFLVLDLHYTLLPHRLWSAPLPLVGLAGDWNLLWHHYRHCLPNCDLILTDTLGVGLLQRQGISQALAANIFGCERLFSEAEETPAERDIDVLFVGNFQPAVQRERLPWLVRLARLARRWRVLLQTNTYGREYRQLLRRARIVFNRSIRGECNLAVAEALASGALLFQEEGNLEVPQSLAAGTGVRRLLC